MPAPRTPREQFRAHLARCTVAQLRAARPQPATATWRLEQWREEMFARGLTDGRRNI